MYEQSIPPSELNHFLRAFMARADDFAEVLDDPHGLPRAKPRLVREAARMNEPFERLVESMLEDCRRDVAVGLKRSDDLDEQHLRGERFRERQVNLLSKLLDVFLVHAPIERTGR